jgi:hypothetical protein
MSTGLLSLINQPPTTLSFDLINNNNNNNNNNSSRVQLDQTGSFFQKLSFQKTVTLKIGFMGKSIFLKRVSKV